MDAIEMLKADHQKVRTLFFRFEQLEAEGGESKAKIIEEIMRELAIHAELEEAIFYPACRKVAKDEMTVLEAYEEHHVAKFLLAELAKLDAEEEAYEAKAKVLKEILEHHITEEETEMFVQAQRALGAERLRELSQQMIARKEQLMSQSPRVTVTMLEEFRIQEVKRHY